MKKTIAIFILMILISSSFGRSSIPFNQFFVDETMRVDYFHTGIKNVDIFSLDQVYEQGVWAGSKVNLLDTLNLGKYLVKVLDAKTNQMLYTRGFCSIFGEWQTTSEAAKGIYRTFHESVLIPFPKRPIQLVIALRENDGYFHDKWSTIIEPNSRFVNREKPRNGVKVVELLINGPSERKVDLLIIAEGYTANEMSKFRKDVKHFTEVFFDSPPFKQRKKAFNIRAIEVASKDSGIDEPRKNIWKNTVCGCSFNSLDSPRYVLSVHNKEIRDIAAHAPYDQLYVLFNSERYGGGGIFNLYSTCFSGTDKRGEEWWADYVFVHEFGHAFGGLADEYYSSSVAYDEFYPVGVEPWEPNITALLDKKHLKWKHLIKSSTPIPTPWDKAVYDSLSIEVRKLDRSASDYAEKYEKLHTEMQDLLRSQKYWGEVGVFEGAGYLSKGMYRPYLDCRMFSKSLNEFDPVCQAAIERMIDFYSK